ncbi:c-type cytochrome [Mucilaginibacter sp. HD30]
MITKSASFITGIFAGAVITCTSQAQNSPNAINGKTLYVKHCTKCHGENGSKGQWGAKDLRKSKLGPEELFNKISAGGWIMPQWRKTFSQAEIEAVGNYVKTLRD